jgi:cytochrome c551/c552
MIRRAAALLACSLALASCGGGGTPVTGIAASGSDIFERTVLGDNAGCITCHSLKPEVVLVGPSLATIGADAGSRQAGITAREYLRTSIVAPDEFVLDGFDPGRMPQDWAEQLTDADIDALVEYLLTLGAE